MFFCLYLLSLLASMFFVVLHLCLVFLFEFFVMGTCCQVRFFVVADVANVQICQRCVVVLLLQIRLVLCAFLLSAICFVLLLLPTQLAA